MQPISERSALQLNLIHAWKYDGEGCVSQHNTQHLLFSVWSHDKVSHEQRLQRTWLSTESAGILDFFFWFHSNARGGANRFRMAGLTFWHRKCKQRLKGHGKRKQCYGLVRFSNILPCNCGNYGNHSKCEVFKQNNEQSSSLKKDLIYRRRQGP